MAGLLRAFYRLGSAYWTYKAATRGRLPQRMARKQAYRTTGRIIRRIIR